MTNPEYIKKTLKDFCDSEKSSTSSVVDLIGALLVKIENLERKVDLLQKGVTVTVTEDSKLDMFAKIIQETFLGDSDV